MLLSIQKFHNDQHNINRNQILEHLSLHSRLCLRIIPNEFRDSHKRLIQTGSVCLDFRHITRMINK